jgi:hypothetical protein
MDADQLFVVEGFVRNVPTTARWTGGALDTNEQLMRRVRLLIARGTSVGGHREVTAALDRGPLPAMLTVMRAFDLIVSVEFVPWIGQWIPERRGA